jgi:hypothetical protein
MAISQTELTRMTAKFRASKGLARRKTMDDKTFATLNGEIAAHPFSLKDRTTLNLKIHELIADTTHDWSGLTLARLCEMCGITIPDDAEGLPGGEQNSGRSAIHRSVKFAIGSLIGEGGQIGNHNVGKFIGDIRELLLKAEGQFGPACSDDAWRQASKDARRLAMPLYLKHRRGCSICLMADPEV